MIIFRRCEKVNATRKVWCKNAQAWPTIQCVISCLQNWREKNTR